MVGCQQALDSIPGEGERERGREGRKVGGEREGGKEGTSIRELIFLAFKEAVRQGVPPEAFTGIHQAGPHSARSLLHSLGRSWDFQYPD